MIQLTYGYFDISDGNAMTLDERIAEILKSLQDENDYIIFEEDEKKCYNEQELRDALEEGGIL